MPYSFEKVDHYNCCGVSHFASFSTDEDDYEDDYEYESISEAVAEMGGNRLAEVILTDGQMERMPDLVRDMAAAGFILVNRFRNSNSGNICNVFHHVPNRADLLQAPGWRPDLTEAGVRGREDEVRAVEAEAVRPTVVHTSFHNVYRDGRVGAGYPSEADARAARRGRGTVRRIDTYSDGTNTVTDLEN